MEPLNSKLYDKYTNLKKRKLLDEGLDQKREAAIKEYHEAMEDLVQELKNENDRLFSNLSSLQQKFAHTQTLLLKETHKTKELSSEILRLQHLLAQKNDMDNSTTVGSPSATPIITSEKQTPVLPAKETPKSSRKVYKLQPSEEAAVSQSCFDEETTKLDCCRINMGSSGDGMQNSCSTCVFHTLVELLVGMKFSVNNELEGFSLSVSHERSGYTFNLIWVRGQLDEGGELLYRPSSLGTLERIALAWMKEDIVFSLTMCRLFFQRIARVIG